MTTTRFPLEGIEAKAVIQKLASTGLGEIFLMPPLIPGLGGNTEATVVACGATVKIDYLLALTYLGVKFADVRITSKAKELVMEVLK